MKKYFYLEESITQPGKYLIKINFDQLPPMNTAGSYNVLPARLLGLPYAEYLRFCRDELHAEIIGKKNMYPVVYFSDKKWIIGLIQDLNTRMAIIEKEKENTNVSNT